MWHRWLCGAAGAAPLVLQGLRQLEYRGYDSAGMAVMVGAANSGAAGSGQAEQFGRVVGAFSRGVRWAWGIRVGDAWRAG